MAKLTAPDYVIIAAYLTGVVVMGLYFSRRQKSLNEYFLASGNMPWWAVAVSLHATLLSPVTFLGMAGWIYAKDSRSSFGNMLLIMPVMYFSAVLWVPIWNRLRVLSIYEYLEKRYHPTVRSFAAALFPVGILFWVGNGLVTASKAFSMVAFSNVSDVQVYTCLVAIMILGTTYTVLGGARAVVWTDVIQAAVFFVAYAASLLMLLAHFGWEPARIYEIASSISAKDWGYSHATLISTELSLAIEATIWVIIFTRILEIVTFGTNQTFVQRLLATGSHRNMMKAMLGKGGVDMIFLILGIATAWGLVAYYHENAEAAASVGHKDNVLAVFVVAQMPVVLRGVIMAGLFAALMSTFDSAINSISSVTINDFYRRYCKRDGSEHHYVAVSRIITIGFGFVLLAYAMWQYKHSANTVNQRLGELNNLVVAPLLCFFVLGIFSRRANTLGVLIGGFVGIIFALLFQGFPGWFEPPIFKGVSGWFEAPLKDVKINWMWIGGMATLVGLASGYAASLLFAPPPKDKTEGLTVWRRQ